MPQFQIDDINVEELFKLKSEIELFINAYSLSEEFFCEGSGEYQSLRDNATAKAHKLRGRIRGLALDWGIHAEFIREYSRTKQNGLQSVA